MSYEDMVKQAVPEIRNRIKLIDKLGFESGDKPVTNFTPVDDNNGLL